MGVISYPRTAGDNEVLFFTEADGTLWLRTRAKSTTLLRYKDWELIKYSYTKRPSAEREELRKKFKSSIKKMYLKHLVNNHKDLLEKCGFDKMDFDNIKKGLGFDGYQVHHILPLDDNGTNDFDNLILIQDSIYHKPITQLQNKQTIKMKENEVRMVFMVVPRKGVVVHPPNRVDDSDKVEIEKI